MLPEPGVYRRRNMNGWKNLCLDRKRISREKSCRKDTGMEKKKKRFRSQRYAVGVTGVKEKTIW